MQKYFAPHQEKIRHFHALVNIFDFFFIPQFLSKKSLLLDQVKNAGSITRSRTFLDLIFGMQVPLGNEKSFGKWPKAAALIKYDHFCNRGYTPIFFFTEGSMFSRTARYMKTLAQFFASFL